MHAPPPSPAAPAPSTGPLPLPLSPLLLGAWRLHQDPEVRSARGAHRLIRTALDLGITTFDHADIYGPRDADPDASCEAIFGAALAEEPGLRERLQLVTKCGIRLPTAHAPKHYDTGRAHLVASTEQSLRRLRTDRIDLLLLHRPDPLLHADEVAEAFSALHRAGKVRAFGVSNFAPPQLELLASRTPLVANQIELSLLRTAPITDGTLDQLQRLRMAPLAWSPLAGGRLFHEPGERADRVRGELARIGEELGAAPDQVALAWLLRHPSRPRPIVGTHRADRLAGAAGALALTLSRPQWFSLWAATSGHDVP